MDDGRRKYLKASVVGAGMVLVAKGAGADETNAASSSNGVVIGHSPKKEILYKKNANWQMYYKAAY